MAEWTTCGSCTILYRIKVPSSLALEAVDSLSEGGTLGGGFVGQIIHNQRSKEGPLQPKV